MLPLVRLLVREERGVLPGVALSSIDGPLPLALMSEHTTPCRMVGQPVALAKALGEVSRLIRANPPKEKPGGCPPSLSRITGSQP